VKLIKAIGLKAYRFSISWTRLIPGVQLSLTQAFSFFMLPISYEKAKIFHFY
jgi:beta-glucosidase/6-phospho-beta-glucosidase/beta-galactosidase